MMKNKNFDITNYVDFILEKDKVWLIDMASAQQSAYWNYNKNLL